jgi:hypothetical protein
VDLAGSERQASTGATVSMTRLVLAFTALTFRHRASV